MKRARLLTLLTAACVACAAASSAPQHEEARTLPIASREPPPIAAGARNDACFAPYEAKGDPKLDPKPIDEAKLHETDAFVRARVFFEAQHWAEAGAAFRELAMSHADTDVGVYAAQLYLECLNVIGSHYARPVCYDELARDLPRLVALYCNDAKIKANEQACDIFFKIDADLHRLTAQRLVEVGDATHELGKYREGAEEYLAIMKSRCLPPKPNASAYRCDEIGYNAAVAFVVAGDTGSADAIRKLMLDPANGMQRSALTKRLICKLDGPTSPACSP